MKAIKNLLFVFFSLVAWSGAMSDLDVAAEYQNSEQTLEQSEVTSGLPLFDENSITFDYLNRFTGLEWKHNGGDWVDRNGTSQGNIPWASANVTRKTQGPISLDVTILASAQRGKKDQLMVLSATIPVRVWSREGDQSPNLKVTFMDDTVQEFSPVLDCFIANSTHKNINSDKLAFNSDSEKAFMQFDIPNKEYKSAILELWPKKIFGSGQIEVNNLAPSQTMFEVKKGIAQGLSSYAELKGHPDVIFIDTFDDESNLKSEWFRQGRGRSEKIKNGFLSGEIDPKRKTHSAINIRYFFSKHMKDEPTESYFRYSVRFHKDFIYATEGGKLPGQAGTYNTCGWGGRKPSKTCEGWSARMSWKPPIKDGPYKDLIPIGSYLYHLGQKGKYGEGGKWQAFCALGKWCELEQYVRLNTPGKSDGILRGYHNGGLVYERTDIRYRDSDNVKIQDVWALIYHGGMGYPTAAIHADIDNVVIAKTFIGILDGAKIGPRIEAHHKKSAAKGARMSAGTNRLNSEPLNLSSSVNSGTHVPSRASKHSPLPMHQNPILAKVADNTVIDLGDFSCTDAEGDGNSCVKVTDYSGMVYDQNHHQILMFGGGHAATFTDTVFIFDFDSLRWKEDYPPTPCTKKYMTETNYDRTLSAWKEGPAGPYPRPISTHTYDLLAVATGLSEFIVFKGGTGGSRFCPRDAPRGYFYASQGKVAHYRLETKTWEFSNTANGDEAGKYASAEYDPISGMIILLGRRGLHIYDPINRTTSTLKKRISGISFANELVYYPPDDRMYYFDRKTTSVWELRLDRNNLTRSTFHKLPVMGQPPPKKLELGYAYDTVNRIIGGAVHDNKFYVFDPRTKTWSSQDISDGKPGNLAFHCIVFDPVDNVFIFLGQDRKTWAYRYRS